jgi:protein tyrosine/serine phosphatase
MKLSIILSLLIYLTAGPVGGVAQNAPISSALRNFHQVNANLYRGGQPKDDEFTELKKLGISTVIDLRDNDDNALKEKAKVEKAGMRFLNYPLGNWSRPDIKDIENILAEINSAANQPVFVHCKRGSDRTGTVIAVYRIAHDGWDAKRASDEAKTFGIGWWEFGMKDFINDYYRDFAPKK